MSERSHVAAEVADRLRRRGIALTGQEQPDELADLLSRSSGSRRPSSRMVAI